MSLYQKIVSRQCNFISSVWIFLLLSKVKWNISTKSCVFFLFHCPNRQWQVLVYCTYKIRNPFRIWILIFIEDEIWKFSAKEKELIYNDISNFASARDQKTDLYFCKIPLMEINFSFINFRRKRLSDYRIFWRKMFPIWHWNSPENVAINKPFQWILLRVSYHFVFICSEI